MAENLFGEDKEKKFVKPAWLPWVIIVVEIAAAFLIGYLICK